MKKQIQKVERKTSSQNTQVVELYDESKVRRTMGTFCCFVVNASMMYGLKIVLSGNMVLFFNLLSLVAIVYSIIRKDFSILFTTFALVLIPFIVYANGLAVGTWIALLAGFFTVFYAKNLTLGDLTDQFGGTMALVSKETVKKRIIRLAKSNLEAQQLIDDDIKEFKDVEQELKKFNKLLAKEQGGMKNAMNNVVTQIETLQTDHARVLVRAAALRNHLSSISLTKIKLEISGLENELKKATDDVLMAQIKTTIEMKQNRIKEIEGLNTNLSRIKMQKIQMKEMFDGLLNRMNTLKLSDITVMEASSDNMVKEVEQIRFSLADLENGLLEIEKQSKQSIAN